MTRKDRAARLQRTTGGRFAKTKPKSNAKETKRDAEDEEDTQDDEDLLSQIDDIRSKRANTKTLGESDGNALRTGYKDPTAHQVLKAHEESITDVDMAVDRQENTRGIIVQQGDIADGTAATRTKYQGPTAHQMLKALEESIADAMDISMDGGNIEPGDAGNNTASTRPTRAGSPVSDDDDNQPSTRGRTQPSRGTSPKPPTPSQSKRILTYPKGPNMPPLITYIHSPPPPPPQPRSPSPRSNYNIRIAPPSNTIHIPLPLAPTPSRPGLVLQSPSRSQSPPSSPVDQWNHQPPGLDSLVRRGGGYRSGSIERWPNLPERVVERMRKGGLEVRGEEIVVRGEEEEEERGEEEDGDGDRGGGRGADDVGLDEGVEGVRDYGMVEGVRQWSEVSSAGDPADTTMSELDSLLEGY